MQEVVALWAPCCLCPKLAIYEKDGFFAKPRCDSMRRHRPRRIDPATRITLAWLSRLFNWRDALAVVQPKTLIRWHRAGFRLLWHWKSKPGRPPSGEASVRQFSVAAGPSASSGATGNRVSTQTLRLPASILIKYQCSSNSAFRRYTSVQLMKNGFFIFLGAFFLPAIFIWRASELSSIRANGIESVFRPQQVLGGWTKNGSTTWQVEGYVDGKVATFGFKGTYPTYPIRIVYNPNRLAEWCAD